MAGRAFQYRYRIGYKQVHNQFTPYDGAETMAEAITQTHVYMRQFDNCTWRIYDTKECRYYGYIDNDWKIVQF
jgi:hypothetical protein